MTEERTRGTDCALPSDAGLLSLERRGLSKREHFAVLLLAGMNANPNHAEVGSYTLCDWAIDQADRLILKLSQADREDA
jgi:hypothetical protein